MFKSYLDVDLAMDLFDRGYYIIDISGPGGDARSTLALPPKNQTLQILAHRLQHLDADEDTLVALGQILFRTLFHGPIKDVLVRSQGVLKEGQGLRIKLHIDPTEYEVAGMPWEYLYDPDRGPLALLDVSIVRYLSQQAVIPRLATALPLKVLLTGAQTPPPSTVERELREVMGALAGLGDYVQIFVEPHLTVSKLQKLLRQGFHI